MPWNAYTPAEYASLFTPSHNHIVINIINQFAYGYEYKNPYQCHASLVSISIRSRRSAGRLECATQ